MTDNLPPSKFGAGYSYGNDQAPSVPAPPPAAPPAPAYGQPAPDPYGQPASYGQVPSPVPPPITAPPIPDYPPAVSGYPPAPAGPGVPAYGAGYPPVARAGGGTAITAGILALLLGASRAYASIDAFIGLAQISSYSSYGYGYGSNGGIQAFFGITGAVAALTALLLIVGGLMLFSRSTAGRALVIVGAIIALIEQIVILGYIVNALGRFEYLFELGFQGFYAVAVGSALAGMVIVILLLIFASVGSTKRWCQSKPAKFAPPVPVVYP